MPLRAFLMLLFTLTLMPAASLDTLMVPLDHPVYTVLEVLEAKGAIPLQPLAKPYTRRHIRASLSAAEDELTSPCEQQILAAYIHEFTENRTAGNDLISLISDIEDTADTNKKAHNTAPLVLGLNFTSDMHAGLSILDQTNEPTTQPALSTSNLLEAVILGGLGDDLSYRATLGVSLDKLSPDLFYKSYTKNGEVNFPYDNLGYAFLPYQFTYDTLWWHANAESYRSDQSAISDTLHYGFRYLIEGTGSFFDDAVTAGFHNLRRSWGHSTSNLLLSEQTRRFPGVELHIRPTDWISYSYLTGSLFYYPAAQKAFNSYGYSLGSDQKNYTIHSVELKPLQHISFALSAANVWLKRSELSYQLPFIMPFFVQLQDTAVDNLAVELDLSARIPYIGKAWFSFFIDEMSFDVTENFLQMPRNRYAYQAGLRFAVPEQIIPMTQLGIQYTRLTPFVYTHAPVDSDGGQSVDVTFTHDGFNLGFYLPPNSDEFQLTLDHIISHELQLFVTGKLIRHGTNDLAESDELLIYGDIFQYQIVNEGENVWDYPLMDFLHDGIYDWTVEAELGASWYPENLPFSLDASIGYGKTWWNANYTGITEPEPREMWTGSLSVSL